MSYSILTILFTSLLGSMHCVGMCGGFAAFSTTSSAIGVFYYHLGRLVTYLFLGVIAGLIGRAINSTALLVGISEAAALLVGVLMVVGGVQSILMVHSKSKMLPSLLRIPHAYILKLTESVPLALRPLILGLASTFLPCGWLYSYVAVAATTGGVLSAVVVMLFFWLGTVPVLTGVGVFARTILARLGAYVSYAPAIVLIIAGAFSISAHFSDSHHAHHSHDSHIHGVGSSDDAHSHHHHDNAH